MEWLSERVNIVRVDYFSFGIKILVYWTSTMLPKPPVVQAFSQPASPVDKVVPDRPKVDVVVAIQVDKVDTGLYTSRGLWKPYGNRGVFGGQVSWDVRSIEGSLWAAQRKCQFENVSLIITSLGDCSINSSSGKYSRSNVLCSFTSLLLYSCCKWGGGKMSIVDISLCMFLSTAINTPRSGHRRDSHFISGR